MNLTTALEATAFGALLGVVPDAAELERVPVPRGSDPADYRAMLGAELGKVAAHRAAGDDSAARSAAEQLITGHQLALTLCPPDPAASFADWLGAQRTQEQPHE